MVEILEGVVSMETSYSSALQAKHAGIERQIRLEMSRPIPDAFALQELKRKKLRIKNELHK